MTAITNYWQLSSKEQEQIKEAHPVTPLYRWQVQGRLNINYHSLQGASGIGFPINQTIIAFNATHAANKVAEEWAAQYKGVTAVDWLNDGPIVTQVIEVVNG